ncbi:TIGR03085 family protein [Nocardia otitidiscaviarum]|uniref:TIGR03085 family metal-binding protein n=1 Tax=Nocardia otitidiscaviarum TaxID=1823 RepID=UPI0004A713F7|nr:TIGR03085 family metal-binding protein [Nocardia otitidiscaviarum]MBF6132538.1 TIGR03085 family protein [Nocardia otitidiscaviarum]MBF6488639.1 TIGR03085 family protein [Nocardia otitidiscaviarum]
MSMAQRERQHLVQTMAAAGPDAPTLCGDWTVRDLAAHLIVRERRPDAAPGILLKPLAGYLERVQSKVARRPFPQLLEQVRTGPPLWSHLRLVDSIANLTEMFVHHEDVRRAGTSWEAREMSPDDEDRLWKALRPVAKMAYRKSPVTVVLATPDGRRHTAHTAGSRTVVLTGPPSELLLHAFGRDEVRLSMSGDPDDVRAVLATDRSV